MTRDENGKFVKGHEKTGGRKKRSIEERYLEVFKKTVSEDDWTEIIAKAVTDAKRGDSMARKFIADYIIGPPVQRTDLTTDGKPLPAATVNVYIPSNDRSTD